VRFSSLPQPNVFLFPLTPFPYPMRHSSCFFCTPCFRRCIDNSLSRTRRFPFPVLRPSVPPPQEKAFPPPKRPLRFQTPSHRDNFPGIRSPKALNPLRSSFTPPMKTSPRLNPRPVFRLEIPPPSKRTLDYTPRRNDRGPND